MKVAVLGAGLAGLTAAQTLRRAGVTVTVYEANPRVAGLAQTYDEDGFLFDFGPHFITNRFADQLGLRSECAPVRFSESVLLHGRHLTFPLGVGTRPRYAASLLGNRLFGHRRSSNGMATVSERLQRHYGELLSHDFLIPMLEKWAGETADSLSPETLTRLPPASLPLLVKNALGALVRIPFDSMAKDPRVLHVYPRSGLRRVFESLLEGLGSSLRLGCPIEELVVEDDKVRGVRVGGRRVPYDHVISTIPASLLPRLAPKSPQLQPLERLRYRALVVVNLKLCHAPILPHLIVWYPQSDIPFFRASEPRQGASFFAPADQTLVCLEFGCQTNDSTWCLHDQDMVELCLDWLHTLYGIERKTLVGSRVVRTPYGYPIYQRQTDSTRASLRNGVLSRLHPCGRNGAFTFQLMEAVHEDARRCARSVIDDGT